MNFTNGAKIKLSDIPAYAAVFVSFLSLCATLYLAYASNRIADRNRISERTATYLKEYKELVTSDATLSYDNFSKIPNFEKNKVEILYGLLVSVVDAMNDAGDQRAEQWGKYFVAIPGPLLTQPENTWTSNPVTLRQIKAARIAAEAIYKRK